MLYFVTHQNAKRGLKAYFSSEDYDREVTSLRSLSRIPGVIRCHAGFVYNGIPCLVLDYCSGGDLLKFLHHVRESTGETLTAYQIQVIARTLHEPLALIHGNGFIHCDIKLENILLQNLADVRSVVFADFGSAQHFPEGRLLHGHPGTAAYQAPEIFSARGFSTPVDIWAFGMSLFILFTGWEYFYETGEIARWSEVQFRATFKKVTA
jgi:serine/threonine protein kinase